MWLALSLDTWPCAYMPFPVYTCAFLWAHCARSAHALGLLGCSVEVLSKAPSVRSTLVAGWVLSTGEEKVRWWWGGGGGGRRAEMVEIEMNDTDTMSNGSSSWENKKYPRNTKTWGVKNMRGWREVRFPTVSNSILQTVRKTRCCSASAGGNAQQICFNNLLSKPFSHLN